MTGGQIKPKAVRASSSDEGTEVANLINYSGLRNRDADSLDEHSVDPAEMWRSAKGDGATWVEFDLGEVQTLDAICLWNHNDAWRTDRGVSKADISVWTEDAGWRKIHDDLAVERAQGSDDYDTPMLVKLDRVKAQKVRFDDLASFGDPDYVGLSEVQFFEAPGPKAIRPQPYDGSGEVGVHTATVLWRPGLEAVRHRVYLGETPVNLRFLGTLEEPSARLSTLARGTTYYWRVDEVRANETVTPGSVWSFTTGRDISGPGDVVVGVPDEGVTSDHSAVGWPSYESPRCATDDKSTTKYLHLAGEVRATGFRTTPEAGAAVVTGLTFTTANDAEERDPVSWELYGSNESIEGPYALIARGEIADFNQATAWPRGAKTATPIAFANDVAYKHYQVLFPTLRAPDRANSMQIAEVELLVAQSQGEQPDLRIVGLEPDPARDIRVLAAWWKLDETGGARVADSSGNGHDGAIQGNPVWQPAGGRVGGALQFDGVDDFVDTGWTPDLPVWTVAAWVKSPAPPTRPVASGPVHGEKNFQINWNHGSDGWLGAVGICVAGEWYSAPFGDLQADTWYHLAGTYDGENLKAYRDGVLITDNSDPSGRPDVESATLKFGRHATADGAFFAGTIDDVCVFACALDAENIKALHSGKGPTSLARRQATSPTPLVQATLADPAAQAEPPVEVPREASVGENAPDLEASAQAADGPGPATGGRRGSVSIVLVLLVVGVIGGITAVGRQRAL